MSYVNDSLFALPRTSVAHMDAPKVVDIGLTQMLSLVVDHDVNEELDVFFIYSYMIILFWRPIFAISCIYFYILSLLGTYSSFQ